MRVTVVLEIIGFIFQESKSDSGLTCVDSSIRCSGSEVVNEMYS